MQRLDSDVANADALLHVEFYEYKGDGPWQGKPFVRIVTPGDKTNIIDQPAGEHHKQRFQRQWLHYQMARAEHDLVGIPLSIWHQERPQELSDGQYQELMILKFLTVEQVAMATDGQIMRIGMGADGLRQRARQFLASKNAQASGAELADAKAQIARLTELVEKMASAAPVAAVKRGKPRGKPFQKKAQVNVNHDPAAALPASSQ